MTALPPLDKDALAKIIREHVVCDASGLSPAVAGCFLDGFEEAADAVLAALPPQPDDVAGLVERLRESLAALFSGGLHGEAADISDAIDMLTRLSAAPTPPAQGVGAGLSGYGEYTPITIRSGTATPPVAEPVAHPDDLAVDRFAAAMKAKLAKKRAEGRGGWDDKGACSNGYLSQLLVEHVKKGDPVDIGNLAMMLHQRGEVVADDRERYIAKVHRDREGSSARPPLSALSTPPVADHAGMVEQVREFQEWLNDRRNADVSWVFHELVSRFTAALSAPQPVERDAIREEGLRHVFDGAPEPVANPSAAWCDEYADWYETTADAIRALGKEGQS